MASDPKIDAASDSSSDAGDNVADDLAGKQNRAEKKTRKAVSKLGMKPVPGIVRVTVKKMKNILFVISKPDCYKAPGSDTYVVFGEAKIEDFAAQQQAQEARLRSLAAAAQVQKDAPDAAGESSDEKKPVEISEEDSSEVPASSVEEKDIELVMTQVNCTREQAISALQKNKNDIVEAIVSFSS